MRPDKHGKFTNVYNLLFCVRTLCMNYVAKSFLLVSSSVSSKQLLCFVHGQHQKSEQDARQIFPLVNKSRQY